MKQEKKRGTPVSVKTTEKKRLGLVARGRSADQVPWGKKENFSIRERSVKKKMAG